MDSSQPDIGRKNSIFSPAMRRPLHLMIPTATEPSDTFITGIAATTTGNVGMNIAPDSNLTSKDSKRPHKLEKLSLMEAVQNHPVFGFEIDLDSPVTQKAINKLHLKPDDLRIKEVNDFIKEKGNEQLAKMTYVHHLNRLNRIFTDIEQLREKMLKDSDKYRFENTENSKHNTSVRTLARRSSLLGTIGNFNLQERRQKILEQQAKQRRQYTEAGLEVLKKLLEKQEKQKAIQLKQENIQMFEEIRENERKKEIEKKKKRFSDIQEKVKNKQKEYERKLMSKSMELEKHNKDFVKLWIQKENERRKEAEAKEKIQQMKRRAFHHKQEIMEKIEMSKSMQLMQTITDRENKAQELFREFKAERSNSIKQREQEYQRKVAEARVRRHQSHDDILHKVLEKLDYEKTYMENLQARNKLEEENRKKERVNHSLRIEKNRKTATKKISDWRKSIETLSLQKLSRAEDIKEKRFEASYELSLYNDSRISRTLENFARISDLHFNRGNVILSRHKQIQERIGQYQSEKESLNDELRHLIVNTNTAKNKFYKTLSAITKAPNLSQKTNDFIANAPWNDDTQPTFHFSSHHASPKNSSFANTRDIFQ